MWASAAGIPWRTVVGSGPQQDGGAALESLSGRRQRDERKFLSWDSWKGVRLHTNADQFGT